MLQNQVLVTSNLCSATFPRGWPLSCAVAQERNPREMFILLPCLLNCVLLWLLACSSLAVRRNCMPGRVTTCRSTGKAKLHFLGLIYLCIYLFKPTSPIVFIPVCALETEQCRHTAAVTPFPYSWPATSIHCNNPFSALSLLSTTWPLQDASSVHFGFFSFQLLRVWLGATASRAFSEGQEEVGCLFGE